MARYGTVKADRAPPAPPAPAAVVALRKDVRMAAISQFINLFKKHVNLQFEIEDLEYDLAGERPNSVVPSLLGKLCNTLANDRYTNSTNWLPALRRAYSRRVTNREDNPFYRYEQDPVDPASAPDDQATSASPPAAVEGTCLTQTMQVDSTQKDGSTTAPSPVTAAAVSAKADAKADEAAKGSAGTEPASDALNRTASAPQPIVVDTTEASNTDLATAAPVASTSALPAAADPPTASEPDDDLTPLGATERRVEVGWDEVDVDTKIQAIYNVCEWHMYEPERFRRSLKVSIDDDDTSWRIEPIGKDAKGNKYYLLDPWRIWIHRAAPKKRKQKGVILVEESDDDDDVHAFRGKGKGKGKGKAKDAIGNGSSASFMGASNGRKHSRSISAGELAFDETPSKRTRRNRTEEVWEEIPKELLQEWGVDGKELIKGDPTKREGSDVSSELTSLNDDEDATCKPVKTGSKPNREGAVGVGTETKTKVQVGETKWEDDFWVERDRIDALEGFIEWEATCLTLDDWTAFADKFAKSHNTHEAALHEHINSVLLPQARSALNAIEKARQQEYFAMVRKRSTRIASKESEEEERQRLAAIKEAEDAKASRASRHKASVTQDPDAVLAAPAQPGQPPQETREERLKKREEEKQAKELALEQVQIEAVAQAQRAAEAETTNGTTAATAVETPQAPEVKEDVATAERIEKERLARVEAERIAAAEAEAAEQAAKEAASKAAKQAEAAKRKKEKKAAKEKQHAAAAAEQAAAAALLFSAAQPVYSVVAAAAAPPLIEAQDPWYFDCEICKVSGWNYDDGHTVMCCEQCEEWQHVACHVQRDLLMNRPAQQYEDERFAFYCSKCRNDPRRKPRKVPAKSTLAKAAAPVPGVASASPQQTPPLVPTPKATAAKAATPKAAATKQQQQQHKPPATPAARPNAKSPPQPKANGHTPSPASAPRPQPPKAASQPPKAASRPPKSASQPPKAAAASTSPATAASAAVEASQPAAQPAASLPAAGQPSLSYPALKALIESNPVLINQLPPQYQSHFSQLLGIPVPYPTTGAALSPKAQTSGSASASAASGSGSAPTTNGET